MLNLLDRVVRLAATMVVRLPALGRQRAVASLLAVSSAGFFVATGSLSAFADTVTSSQIRDRVLSRIERGRFMRAPAIGTAKTAVGGGPGYESVIVDGKVRLFVRYTPNKVLLASKPAPVVFALHGAGGRADLTGNAIGLNKLADAEGFIAVYPQAADGGWQSAADADRDDVDFLNRLADALIGQNVADPKRLYLAGVGAGAGLTVRLACSDASRFAAYGIVGPTSSPEPADCRPSPPRLSIFSGTSVDEAGSSAKPAGAVAAIGRTEPSEARPGDQKGNDTKFSDGKSGDLAQRLARNVGCGAPVQTTQSGKVSKAKWTACGENAEIESTRSSGERLALERVVPELWSFFRRFGG